MPTIDLNRATEPAPPAASPRETARAALARAQARCTPAHFRSNIESFVGVATLPVGLAGPLLVRGEAARGTYPVPLATTEAALVASYARGCRLITAAGGASAAVTGLGVQRAPGFAFATLAEARRFADWVARVRPDLERVAATTTRHGRLSGLRPVMEGNHVYLVLTFETGDASGQNMVTFAADAILAFIAANAPVSPRRSYLEANLSGDKKANAHALMEGRGRKAVAEIILPDALLRRHLRTDAAAMTAYWRMSALGGVLMGSVGVQGHFANGLAALYIATGQDVATVAEAAIGITRLEIVDGGDLYASVTLPNLLVGTVGGGTGLASQRACLELMGLYGTGKADALAEVIAALCLAGELSIIGALCSGDFARAHRSLARGPGRG